METPRTRLTREESQQRTRRLLLEAAHTEIARHGVVAASVRNIAEAAGFSQGAFYSNFTNKDTLLVELAKTQMLALAADFQALIDASAAQTLDETLAGIARWLKDLHANRDLAMLTLELQMYANRNPGFTERMAEQKVPYLTAFANGFSQLFARYDKPPPLPPLHAAIGFIALWHGFSVQWSGHSPVPPDEVYLALLRALFEERQN